MALGKAQDDASFTRTVNPVVSRIGMTGRVAMGLLPSGGRGGPKTSCARTVPMPGARRSPRKPACNPQGTHVDPARAEVHQTLPAGARPRRTGRRGRVYLARESAQPGSAQGESGAGPAPTAAAMAPMLVMMAPMPVITVSGAGRRRARHGGRGGEPPGRRGRGAEPGDRRSHPVARLHRGPSGDARADPRHLGPGRI
jgi:hypothetical protein